MRMELADFVGSDIWIQIPHFTLGDFWLVRLFAVADDGIWIESEELSQKATTRTGAKPTPDQKLVHFVPYDQIAVLTAHVESSPAASITRL
jgi:hypothetical protein